MRVVVAGRPNPPIPDDVPDWHPLRDLRIIRGLSDSPYARDAQRLGRQELHRLLRGSPAEKDLLGLLTAARGGLSGPDLEELTGTPLWEIEQILHTVTGRTFTRRASQWAPGAGPEVYLLGHEELHTAATRYLGRRLAGYHDRLNEWADAYRAQGWPPGTPEYLLHGYFSLLQANGETSRILACAVDSARHDQLLSHSGGDTAALGEIAAAIGLILEQPCPDLAAMIRLAYYRDRLTSRNLHIPNALPAIWATLGNFGRAEALAVAIADPGGQVEALSGVARALSGAGQSERAIEVATRAEITAATITNPGVRARALASVARALSGAGQSERAMEVATRAETTAATITSPGVRAQALANVAGALAAAGLGERAREVANQARAIAATITSPVTQAQALASIAQSLADVGLTEQAEETAAAITSRGLQARALARVARTLAETGLDQRAREVVARAEATARTITDPRTGAEALAGVARALAGAGVG
jgi:hypothetical protein